jgi:hypothetical protein
MSIDTSTLDSSYLLFIRSKEVTQLTTNFNSNMKITLDAQITRTNALQDIHLQLSSCEIPVSFYNFSSNLNNINLFLDGSSSLILTEQQYDIYDMIDEITNASFPYSLTFDYKKSKVTLSNTDNTEHIINFSQENSRGLSKALGFDRTDILIPAGTSITSNDVINLNTIHSIFVHTNIGVNNVITTTNNNYRNIIQKIPVTKEFGSIINYNPYQSSLFSSVLSINSINTFEISLRDQNDVLIQFNDVNYELSLLFEIHQNNPAPQVNLTPPEGGRRSFIPPPVPSGSSSGLPLINKPLSIPTITSENIGQLSMPVASNILTSQVGGFSNPKPNPIINTVIEEPVFIKEDKLLDDKQSDKLQSALLNLELLDTII